MTIKDDLKYVVQEFENELTRLKGQRETAGGFRAANGKIIVLEPWLEAFKRDNQKALDRLNAALAQKSLAQTNLALASTASKDKDQKVVSLVQTPGFQDSESKATTAETKAEGELRGQIAAGRSKYKELNGADVTAPSAGWST